jgi:MoxR-like ATPase
MYQILTNFDLTFKEAAIEILQDANEPLHYKEITKRALTKNIISSSGKTPELSLLRDMTEDIRINKEKSIFKKKSEGVYYIESRPNHFLAMGPWSNWQHSLQKKPVLWGVKPDTSNTNIGVFNQLKLGDIVFLYVSRKSPSKFSTYGIFGVGKVVRTCSNEKLPYWPDEIDENKVVYTHRFEIELIKIIDNDHDLLWFNGLPNVKGLNVIKSENTGLKPLLESVKNKWNVSLENPEKCYLIQNKIEYPILRKADIDKIFDINYARGITDYGRNNYIVLISSLAGVYRDNIGEEFILYAGQGQTGDQTLTGGNAGIIEAKNNGRKLYFLQEMEGQNGKRTHEYKFLGEVKYVKHEFEIEPSKNSKVIRFTLKRINSPWNIQENNKFTGFDFVNQNTHELPNNSKLISFEKIHDDYYFKGYGHNGNFKQEPCIAPLRNLFLPITSKISPFCSKPVLNTNEIKLKEQLEQIIKRQKYGISGQSSIVLISILYWLSKTKFTESSLVDYLKNLNIKSDNSLITELELIVNNSKLFADYVLIYKLYQSLGLMKFEIIDRIGFHIKQSLEMNNASDRLISYLSKNDIDSELSKLAPNRTKVLLYTLLQDYLDESTLIDFWGGLYGKYTTVKCSSKILEKIKNMPNFDPESPVIEIKSEIHTSLMSQFSEISQTQEVSDGKLRIPTKNEIKKGIAEIQKELLIDDSIIEEIVTHLASGRHVLLAGPVGTGKTRISQLISEVFWTDNCGYFADVRTATADWNTQDVIGGISPKIQEGSKMPTYEIENGCVTDTILANYEKGSRLSENPQRHTSIHTVDSKKRQFNGTWLVIDEFNRADIDKAFGQLFTALEYNRLTIQDITSGKSIRTIPIPKDYRIIGTLNTADKHYLFNLSDALKRRFAYVEISIPERNEENKLREIYLAMKNGLKDLDSEEFDKIIKINSDNNTMEYYSDKMKKNIEYGYNILEVVREFKPLGTAILKAIYQTLLVSEKMENNDSFDNAINANLTPQLETLPKPSLEILHAYVFGNVVEFLENKNHREQYKTGLEALLRYLNFSSDEIKISLTEFVNGQIPKLLSEKTEEMKKLNSISFPTNSLFKKSLEAVIKQSEF